MKFQILTVFWGEPYKTWFLNGCLKSLASYENKKAILEDCSSWNIFCDPDQIPAVEEATKAQFPELNINTQSTENLRAFIDQHQSAMCWQIDQCLKAKERLLFAPPDTIFADGTIPKLLKLGREPKSCVAVAHPRVLPEILEDIQNDIYQVDSKSLVKKSWKYLHQSWADAETGHPRQNSFIGGVRWEKLDKDLYAVTHHLPTVYLADFTDEDLMYFKTRVSFGSYDHEWPSDLLIRQQRQRLVGSSDAGFIAEITERLKNIPPVKPGPVDGFWREHPHNLQNRQTTIIFRG